MIKEKRKQFKHDRALLKEGSDGAADTIMLNLTQSLLFGEKNLRLLKIVW